MKSRIVGTVPLDLGRLAEELPELDRAAVRDDYSEYTFGDWRSYVLANPTGEEADSRFRPSATEPIVTALGRRLPYVLSLVDAHFNRRTLRWVRIFTVQDALLITHRDFVEFDSPYHRLHLVLDTDPSCLHSEHDTVFHMRRGEIWEVDGVSAHAACTLSNRRRVSLVLDFEGDGAPVETRLRAPAVRSLPSPCVRRTPSLSAAELAAIKGLRAVASAENFRDIVNLLGKVHFYRRVGATAVFDWLDDICQDDPALIERARSFRCFCLEERRFDERFGDDAA